MTLFFSSSQLKELQCSVILHLRHYRALAVHIHAHFPSMIASCMCPQSAVLGNRQLIEFHAFFRFEKILLLVLDEDTILSEFNAANIRGNGASAQWFAIDASLLPQLQVALAIFLANVNDILFVL
mmetsp:Transcript_2201/g.8068  ORF Transcript_2201/g.8068 Transcript_2201/m.8068 type:complete len:125 (+) Transcript_2201:53-427(+)